jgi:hypothetical protein
MTTKTASSRSFLKSGQGKRPSKAKAAVSVDQMMMPLSLRLTQPQLDGLAVLRQKTGLRQNELVRRAIDEYLRKELA